jgi:hypothetical protein
VSRSDLVIAKRCPKRVESRCTNDSYYVPANTVTIEQTTMTGSEPGCEWSRIDHGHISRCVPLLLHELTCRTSAEKFSKVLSSSHPIAFSL